MAEKKTKAESPKDALGLVHLRNNFYRDNFRLMVWVLLASIALNVALAMGFISSSHRQPGNFYFATTENGQLIPLYPTSQPVVSNSTVINWVSNNVPKIYQIDFVNYRAQLDQLQGFFTGDGWQQFVKAFGEQLNDVVNQKLVLSATPTDVPVILGHRMFNGTYQWLVQMPLVLHMQQGDGETTQKILVSLTVDRVNNVTADQLLGISQIIQTLQGP